MGYGNTEEYLSPQQREALIQSYLGKTVDVVIDRPIGYHHVTKGIHLDYTINYGYLPGVTGGDGEEQDVYILGVEEPITHFTGRIIGAICRSDDNEDKLVAAPEGMVFRREEIAEATYFVEKYFHSEIRSIMDSYNLGGNHMYETLKTRRSIRKYKPQQVTDQELDAVLEAGLYAPTAKNNQKSVMVAVRDKETRDLLSKMNAAVMGVNTDPFYGAPCVIVVLADPEFPTWIDDGSLVLGNLMNAAHALGLGSCWINRAREVFDTAEGKELLKKWGLPERYRGVGNCILGYADEEPAPKPRAEGRVIKV